MNVVPLPIARISVQLQSNLLLGSVQSNMLDMAGLESQISTGQRLNRPSDDPVAAVGIVRLRQQLSDNTQYQTNLNFAGGFLAAADNAASGLSDLITQASSIASSQIGAGSTPDERAAQATVVDSILSRVYAISNQQYQNASIFGGENGTQAAFVSAGGGYKYNGSTTAQGVLTPDGSTIPYTLNGNDVFGGLSSQVVGYKNLSPALAATTRISDLSGARNAGVSLGQVQLTDGATTLNVDLSGAATVGDVVSSINTALTNAGLSSSVSLAGGSIVLNAGGAGNFAIADLGNGTAAADLGIATMAPSAGSQAGANVNARITDTTPLALLNGGAGIDPSGIVISNGAASATVTLAGVNTVQDLVNKINASGTNVRAEIKADGTGLNLYNPVSGTEFRIGENGGATAEDLGLRSFQPATKLADFNFGTGITPISRSISGPTGNIVVTRTDGTTFSFAADKITTSSQLAAALNAASGGTVTASVNTTDNSLALTDTAGGAGNLTVSGGNNFVSNGSTLGIFQVGAGATLTGTPATFSTDDFRITRHDGTSFTVNLTGAGTVQDVLNAINNADGNTGANQVSASLVNNGNGVQLTDSSVGPGALTVAALNSSPVAAQLGIAKTSASGTLAGDDVNPLEPRGLFSSLALLRDGLATNDNAKIQRAATMLQEDSSRVIRVRGTVGARAKDIAGRLDDASNDATQMNSSLVDLSQTDMAAAISKYQLLQTAYQASLKVAQVNQNLSLMDFLK
jgi:flagellar hook-associated protein 3 FlgL